MSKMADIRSRAGGHHGRLREEYDRRLLQKLIEQVQPTDAEWRRIRKSVARYGKTGPTFGEVMGLRRTKSGHDEWWDEPEPARPGIWSIANLIAMGYEMEAAA